MKLKNLIFLFSLYLSLTSCADSIPSLALPDSPEATEEYIETTTHLNIKYLHLLDIVERLRIYVAEEKDKFISAEYIQTCSYIEENAKLQYIKQLEAALNPFSDIVESIYDTTLKLIDSQISIDKYLGTLLSIRICYLNNRKQITKGYLSIYHETADFQIPTSTRLFNWLLQDNRFKKLKEYNDQLRVIAIQKFETLNLLIREAYRSGSIDELTDDTIELLRKSVQLHPILEGTSQDLGHPDTATSDYMLLEKLIFHSTDDEDFTSSLLNLIDKETRRTAELLCKTNNYEQSLKLLAHYLYNLNKAPSSERSKGENKLIDKLLAIRANLDTEVFEAHTSINPTTQLTNYEAGIWPYELPYPVFLRKAAEQPVYQPSVMMPTKGLTKNQRKKQQRRQRDNKKQEINTKVETKQEEGHNSAATQASSNATQAPILEITKEPIEQIQKEELEFEKGKEKLVVKKEESEKEKGGKSEKQELAEESIVSQCVSSNIKLQEKMPKMPTNCWSFEKDWILPKGLRVFHSTMFPSPYPAHSSKTHSDIITRLFNPRQAYTVTFKEFHTLWLSEGGKIDNSGGSHKELIGPDLSHTVKGKTLFGIFAHSNNQTYKQRYIKYLQTAVLYIGLRPDCLITE